MANPFESAFKDIAVEGISAAGDAVAGTASPTSDVADFEDPNTYSPTGDELIALLLKQHQLSREKYNEHVNSHRAVFSEASKLGMVRGTYMRQKSACIANGRIGAYVRIWRRFKKYLQTHHPEVVIVESPCSGATRSDSAPWATHDLSGAYLQHLASVTEKGKPGVAQALSAMNFLLSCQHELARLFLGEANCPPLSKLRHVHGISGQAVASATKNSKRYRKAKSAARDGKGRVTRQSDPQRGRVASPLDEKDIDNIHLWLLLKRIAPGVKWNTRLRDKCGSRFERSRTRLLFSGTFNAVSRGDDLRSPDVSWGHSGMLPLPDSHLSSEKNGYIFYILKDTSKANKDGISQLMGMIRHISPLQCGVNSVGEYLILAYGREAGREFPDIFNPFCNWTKNEYIVTDNTGKRPMEYKKGRKSVEVTQNGESIDYDEEGHYEIFSMLKEGAGLGRIKDKTTHFRVFGAMYGDIHGATEPEMERLGRWHEEAGINKTMLRHYLKNLPPRALLAMGNHHGRFGSDYVMKRGRTMDIGELDDINNDQDYSALVKHVFPHSIERAFRARRALAGNPVDVNDPISVSNYRFTLLCVSSTVAWLQDAVLLVDKYPDLYNEPPYCWLLDHEVSEFWDHLKERVMRSVNDSDEVEIGQQLERADILNKVRQEHSVTREELTSVVPREVARLVKQQEVDTRAEQAQLHVQQLQRITGAKWYTNSDSHVVNAMETRVTNVAQNCDQMEHNVDRRVEQDKEQGDVTDIWLTKCKLDTEKDHGKLGIYSMVKEWVTKVIPREECGNTMWWNEQETSKQRRCRRRNLYEVMLMISVTEEENGDRGQVLIIAQKFEEFVRSIDAVTPSDVEALIALKKRGGESIDIFDEEQLSGLVTTRKQKQKEKQETRKRRRKEHVNI